MSMNNRKARKIITFFDYTAIILKIILSLRNFLHKHNVLIMLNNNLKQLLVCICLFWANASWSQVNLGNDTTLCAGQNITLNATTAGATAYLWSTGANTASITSTGFNTYSVTVSVGASTLIDTLNITACQTDLCNREQGNIWYFGFGGAGLNFNTNPPTVLTNGQVNTFEGVSTISDLSGNLLFYTDGITVWDRNHTIMTNGAGLFGNPSSTQSGVIVPHPARSNIYYIFTTDFNNGTNGCRYSVVDMNLRGGLGDVISTQKNILLFSNHTERITAVKHCNGRDYWVATHEFGNANFRTYLIDQNGLNTSPLIQAIGSAHTGSTANKLAYMRFSADGTKMATTIFVDRIVEVFDFNNSTGAYSNPISMFSNNFGEAYGVEFSADSRLLYVSKLQAPSQLYQLDLTSNNSATILSTMTLIAQHPLRYAYGALQLGPDGRVYVCRSNVDGVPSTPNLRNNYLAVINNPSNLGISCNFQDSAIHLLNGGGYLGLPNFIQSSFASPAPAIQGVTIQGNSVSDTFCSIPQNVTYFINRPNTCGLDSIRWYLNGTILSAFTDTFVNINLNTVGNQTLIAQVFTACQTGADTLNLLVNPFTINLGNDTTLCASQSNTLNATQASASTYIWSTGATTATINTNNFNIYSVTVTNQGCTAVDTFVVNPCQADLCNRQQSNIWYFGFSGAGLNFNTNPPTVLTNGQVNTFEGVSTMADLNGNLLFYTDGIRIWDRNHTIMTNGSGLLGNSSSGQSAVIVPHPARANLYYVFTTDAWETGTNYGCHYSVVDMNLRGGLGDVIVSQKNILLFSNFTEKLTAVKHCNGRDYWVSSHEFGNANYRTYLINQNGLNTTPLIQTIGSVHAGTASNRGGLMRFSSDGKKMAAGIYSANRLEVFDFDNSTGIFSNLISLNLTQGPYGVEFSPDARLLYLSELEPVSRLRQFDLSSNNAATILASSTLLASNSNSIYDYGQLQLAPNGRIYVAGRFNNASANFLSTINNPNNLGVSCNFQSNTVNLGTGRADLGLPNFIQSNFALAAPAIQGISIQGNPANDTFCVIPQNVTYFINRPNTCGLDSIRWYLNGTVVAGFADTFATINLNTAGTQTLIAQVFTACQTGADTLNIQVTNPPNNLSVGADRFICGTIAAPLSATAGFTSYLWSNGQTNANITATAAGNYSVTATDLCGTRRADTVLVFGFPAATVSITGVSSICAGETAVWTSSYGFSYEWSTGAITDTIQLNTAGNYSLTIVDDNACTATVNRSLVVNATPSVILNPLNVNCFNGNDGNINAIVSNGLPNYTFLWSNAATSQNISGLTAGSYIVTVTDANNCTVSSSNTITEPTSISISSTFITQTTCGLADGGIVINVMGGNPNYTFLWSNAATSQNINGLAAGNYIITATDANNCQMVQNFIINSSSSLSISTNSTANVSCFAGNNAFINPNISGGTAPYTFLWSNNATTQNISGLPVGVYNLTVTDAAACIINLSTITISQPTAISLSLQSIQNNPCHNNSNGQINTSIQGGVSPYIFLWSNNQTTQNINGLPAATYSLTATDANNCNASLNNISVSQPNPLTVAINPNGLTLPCDLSPIGVLSAQSTGGTAAYSFVWSNGQTNADISGLAAGNYIVTVTDANNCTTSNNATINNPLIPTLDAFIGQAGQSYTTISLGSSTTINSGNNNNPPIYIYNWVEILNPAHAFIQTPIQSNSQVSPDQIGNYQFIITATPITGAVLCSVSDTVYLFVEQNFLGFPNAFTPNGDGQNDRFRPIRLESEYIRNFKIFNRWGEIVYDNKNLSDGGWDGSYKGENQPREVYIYVISYQRPEDNSVQTLRGEFTLIR